MHTRLTLDSPRATAARRVDRSQVEVPGGAAGQVAWRVARRARAVFVSRSDS
jgi:hypothetical protein